MLKFLPHFFHTHNRFAILLKEKRVGVAGQSPAGLKKEVFTWE